MKQIIFLFLMLIAFVFSYGQSEVKVFSDFVIYKGDTFNRFDINGKKTGEWLMLKVDTVYSVRIGPQPFLRTTIFEHLAIGKGKYLNGKRQGKWIYGNNDFTKIYSEVIYFNDTLSSPILFYTSNNQLWLKAEKINSKWTYFKWEIEKKTFINTYQNYTFDFLFGMDDFDYNLIK